MPTSTNAGAFWPGAWTDGTNGLRVTLFARDKGNDGTWILVGVGSVIFSSGAYFGSPDEKFAKFELRDPAGLVVPFRWGRSVEGQLKPRISIQDLPRRPRSGPKNHMFIEKNDPPYPLADLKIADLYKIKEDGEYTLTVCPVIYKLGTNSQYLDRVDLPCVSTKIQLSPVIP